MPTRTIPDVVVRIAALFSPEFRPVAHDLHAVRRVSGARLREILGVRPRPARAAIVAAAESLLASALVDR